MLQKNITNRTLFCRDNLDILKGINSQSIDLIYLDPPFNKNKTFTAPIGSSAEGASFKDYFREEDVKSEWVQTIKEDHLELYQFLSGIKSISNNKYYLFNYCYLTYMAIRLIECHRVLKATGSVYFHCDSTMSHYIKLLMDIIFGEQHFRNEIIWYYSNKQQSNIKSKFLASTDTIFFYSKSNRLVFNPLEKILSETSRGSEVRDRGVNTRTINGEKYYDVYDWVKYKRLVKANKVDPEIPTRDLSKKKQIKYEDNCWHINIINPQSKERTGYPTQKPLALLDRIIKVSSNKGDIVLDPFCGCATTCVSAEKLGRQWIGIDVSQMAYELVKKRLEKEVANPEDLFQYQNKIYFTTVPPRRTDINGDGTSEKKYVYVISNRKYKGEYKVGVASDVKARLNSYQTSDPNRAYKLDFSLLTPFFREVEAHIHETFENRHEWVREGLQTIVKEIKNYNKN